VRGQGPLCFAHPGGPGLDSSYLHDSGLEKHFTVVYVDPLGTGSSTKLAEPELYSIARDADVLEALRVKLGIDKLCLIGHSYGGTVVMTYAVAHPDRVRGMFLYSTTPTSEPEWLKDVMANLEWFKDRKWFADGMKAIGEEDAAPDEAALNAVFARELPFFFADFDGRRGDFTGLIGRMRVSFEVARRRPKGKQARYDVRGKFGRLHTTPTLIVTGDKDFSGGPVPSGWIQQSIAGSKLVVIPSAGHFAHVEQPAAFDAAVGQFAESLGR
jgi:proline iminopeptidase